MKKKEKKTTVEKQRNKIVSTVRDGIEPGTSRLKATALKLLQKDRKNMYGCIRQ